MGATHKPRQAARALGSGSQRHHHDRLHKRLRTTVILICVCVFSRDSRFVDSWLMIAGRSCEAELLSSCRVGLCWTAMGGRDDLLRYEEAMPPTPFVLVRRGRRIHVLRFVHFSGVSKSGLIWAAHKKHNIDFGLVF